MIARSAAIVVALAICGLAQLAAAERIRSFDVDVALTGEDAFTVEERILYDFESVERHGIYRDIPFRYARRGAADYQIALEVESVRDESGRSRPYRTSREGSNLRIRIGDPDRTVGGLQEYRIRYHAERAILFLDERDELYWNATGNEWPVAIDEVTTTVHLMNGADTGHVTRICFTGRLGAAESECAHEISGSELNAITFSSTRRLEAREGMTVAIGMPKGWVREPTAAERFRRRLGDWLSAWFLLPLGVLGTLYSLWRRSGRDRGDARPVQVRYEPPEGLSPAEVGVVVDESVDMIDITATILDLAVRGYLRIEERETQRLLFLKDSEYTLVKLRDGDELRRHEARIFELLFESRDERTLSDLKDHFYQHLPSIRRDVYHAVSREDRYFPVSPDRVRKLWRGISLAVGVVGVLFAHSGGAPAAVSVVASAAIVFTFAGLMPRRTRRGRRAYEEILGFQEFVERVDADRLERSGGRTADRFERWLPYAVVLGVADHWAEVFADVYTAEPSWYHSPHSGAFRTPRFVTRVSRSLDTMGQTMGSTPKQSGSGSSGFGGGGFSGGGFGGGGGGSW